MAAADKVRVLLVDDRPEKLLTLEAILSDLPVDLVLARSGRDALRQILQRDFAVILLDVNMPGMDGFETAQLIRRRKSSESTPIIFVTAHEDEFFLHRGYSLGAVDCILQPVMPDILRTKVSVFVDLFRKNQLVLEQASWQRQRVAQLKRLAQASVEINGASTMRETLQVITDTARELIEANQAITVLLEEGDGGSRGGTQALSSFTDKYSSWRGRPLELDFISSTVVARRAGATRLTAAQLLEHPDWEIVAPLVAAGKIPPVAGMLAAPLIDRDGKNLGVIYVSDSMHGEFTEDDEAILVQLSQMGAVAVGNLLSAEAREANRAKDQFIAVLSHELRTPLTPVLALLEELEGDGRLSPEVAEDISIIRRNVDLEARLIDDLLDLTRISKGKVELRLGVVDAHESIHETLRICSRDIEEKKLRISVELKAELSLVLADSARLQQIFWNLLKNAVKFTPAGGNITIRSDNGKESELQISITDSGVGIPADVLPRIFKAFEQGRASITRQFGGLGLGLAVSKMLVERHNGTIAASSAGPGRGATFTVSMPTQPADSAADPARKPTARRFQASTGGRRVLLVEDHADTSRVMARLLRQSGYTVETANSMSGALELADQFEPEVLISDIGLPDGTGLELMQQLGARRRVTGIAISGYGMEQDIVRSRAAGFSHHLIKPVSFATLLESLSSLEAETLLPASPVTSG
jgi:signal transduction histidine kinase